MKWFRKKIIEIHHEPFLPKFDYENCTKEELMTFLKSLSRPQLMHLGDTLDFDEVNTELDLWALYYQAMDWHGVWPKDDDTMTALNALYWNKDNTYKDVEKLKKQVEGIQKKLDKIEKLIENAEFKLCGKEALKL